MNILFVTHHSGLGGANRALLSLILNLKKFFNVTSTVIVPEKGLFTNELHKNGIDYSIIKINYWQYQGKCFFIKRILSIVIFSIFNIFRALKVKYLLRKTKISLIHANSSVFDFGFYLKIILVKPLVWHLRESGEMHYNLKFRLGKRIAGKIFSQSNSLIAVSNYINDYYSAFVKKEINVIYDGVPLPKIKCIKDKKSSIINICVIGMICEGKNQIEAIKALNVLVNDYKMENIKLFLIGTGLNDYKEYLEREISNYSLGNYIVFTGYMDNVPEYIFNYMDLMIITSKNEGFGLVTVESMLCKIPVIASNSGANIELIQNGTNGFLYNLGDYNDLALKIETSIANQNITNHVVNNAFKYATENYIDSINAEKIYKEYVKVLKDVC